MMMWGGVIFIASCWVLWSLGHIFHRSFFPAEEADPSLIVAKAREIDAAKGRRDFPRGVERVGLLDLCVKLGPMFADVVLDVYTILNLLGTDNPVFAGVMAVIFSASMTIEFLEGSLWSMKSDVKLTLQKGI